MHICTIKVQIDDSKATLLWKKSEEFVILTEQLVLASVEELVAQPESAFEEAMQKVISNNKELYKRLA